MVTNRLKELRIARRISQKDFAQILGVSQQTVASWEVGRTEPANNVLKDIAIYFEVSTDYLLGLDNANQGIFLSGEQKILLRNFNELSDDGKKTILYLVNQLAIVSSSNTASSIA